MEEPVSPLTQACTLPLLRTGFHSPASSSAALLETTSKSAPGGSASTRAARSSRVPLPSSWFDEEPTGSSNNRSPPSASKSFCDEVFTPPQVMMRRTMAAVAGGGFRGPQVTAPKACMCETLKARLAKAQAELRELRAGSKGKRSSTPGLEEVQTETSAFAPSVPDVLPPLLLPAKRTAEVGTQYKPPSDHAATQTAAEVRAVTVTCAVQTDAPLVAQRRDADCQTKVQTGHRLVQTDDAPRLVSKEMSVQTTAVKTVTTATAEASTQSVELEFATAEIQTGCPFAELQEVSIQTEAAPVTATAEVAVMTSPPPRQHNASTNTDSIEEKPARATSNFSCQTTAVSKAARGVQASPPPGVAVAVQFDDPSGALRESERAQALRDNKDLRRNVDQLGGQLETIQAELSKWRGAAQSQLLSRINITILCPRAECMVNSTRLCMDSWDPDRLRQEFEKEVLPRFSKLFINEENGPVDPEPQSAHMALVDRTMKEFADYFRQRLTAILSAPSAAAAVTASGVL